MLPALIVPSVRPRALLRGGPLLGIIGSTTQLSLRQYLIGGGFDDSGTGVSWSSSNRAVATVSGSGLVSWVSAGSVTITASVNGLIFTLAGGDLLGQFNALGGGTIGATMPGLYVDGSGQTVYANGDIRLASPATNSPTGYWCVKHDHAASPNTGLHLRPSAGINGGNGAPCTPFNTGNLALGGTIAGQGLELPSSVIDGWGPFTTDDTTASNTIANSGGLYEMFGNHSTGLSFGGFGKDRNNTTLGILGESGAANKVEYIGDVHDFPVTNGASSGLSGGAIQNQGTPILHWGFWAGRSSFFGDSFGNYYLTRDINLDQDLGTNDILATGRRFRWLVDGGWIADTATAQSSLYFLKGRMNKAQRKMLCDWGAQRYPTIWEDTRRLGYLFGDSWQAPASAANIADGSHNGAAIPNFGLINFARSGNTVARYQYPFANYIKDSDFSQRPGVAILASEWLNAGADSTAETQNFFWVDALRAADPKIRVGMYNITYSQGGSAPATGQAAAAYLAAHAVQDGHCTLLLDFISSEPWSTYNFADGSAGGQVPVFWNGSNHPSAVMQEYHEAFYRNGFLALLGVDDSAITMRVDPTLDNLSLSTAGATGSTSWTPRNRIGTTLAGKTIAYSSGNTGVATVDAVTGIATRVAAGQSYIKGLTNDGGEGIVVLNCPVIGASDTFTRADNASSMGTTETGGLTWTYLSTGVWGISSNQAYNPTNSGSNKDAAVVDVGLSDCTVQVTLAVGATSGSPRVVFRATDLSNSFMVQPEGGSWHCYRLQAGSFTQIGSPFIGTTTDGDVVKVVLSGSSITVFINGVSRITATDTFNQTATKHGIGANGSNVFRWDTFSAA